ncbi:MAG: hypothetical protein KKG59_00260 [Nanoarchaeota archaeon]|nr:hypothetical protein [Nanoarchaeota archaeon]
MNKRGQLTIFVIIGIVLIIVFAISFFLKDMIENAPTPGNEQAAELKKNIDSYIGGCVELLTEEAVYKATSQGGDIYDIQCSGACNNPDNVHWFERKKTDVSVNKWGETCLPIDSKFCVSYGIRKFNKYDPSGPYFNANENEYPSENFNIEAVTPDETPAFGDNGLRKLCAHNGPNKKDYTQRDAVPCHLKSYDAPYYEEYANFSIQSQITYYIASKLPTCADFSDYVEKGYDIEENEHIVTVELGDRDMTVTVDYPNFTLTGQGLQQNELKSSVKLNIPLKRLYEYTYQLIQKEISNINFDPTDDSQNSLVDGYMSFFITKEENACAKNPCFIPTVAGSTGIDIYAPDLNDKLMAANYNPKFDDIITVQDPDAIVMGAPLAFNFAVRNRRPVVSVFDPLTGDAAPVYKSPATIRFRALDPDDESATSLEFHINPGSPVTKYQFDCDGYGNVGECNICFKDSVCGQKTWSAGMPDPALKFIANGVEQVWGGAPLNAWHNLPTGWKTVSATFKTTHVGARDTVVIQIRDQAGEIDKLVVPYHCCKDQGSNNHNTALAGFIRNTCSGGSCNSCPSLNC